MAAVSCKTFDERRLMEGTDVPESLLEDVLPLLLQETGELVHINRRGWFSATRRPRTSYTCSMGAKSGERAGQSILGSPTAAGSL